MPKLSYRFGHEQKALELLKRRRRGLVSQEELIATLWPAKPPEHATNQVSHVISRLRRKGFVIEHVMGYRVK